MQTMTAGQNLTVPGENKNKFQVFCFTVDFVTTEFKMTDVKKIKMFFCYKPHRRQLSLDHNFIAIYFLIKSCS